MEIRGATRNPDGTIDCEINHPQYGWVAFTANPADVMEYGIAIYAVLHEEGVADDPARKDEVIEADIDLRTPVQKMVDDNAALRGENDALKATLVKKGILSADDLARPA